MARNTPESVQQRRIKVVTDRCTPEPMKAAKRVGWAGKRNTSPWMSFHPDSSSTMSSSSISMYLPSHRWVDEWMGK